MGFQSEKNGRLPTKQKKRKAKQLHIQRKMREKPIVRHGGLGWGGDEDCCRRLENRMGGGAVAFVGHGGEFG